MSDTQWELVKEALAEFVACMKLLGRAIFHKFRPGQLYRSNHDQTINLFGCNTLPGHDNLWAEGDGHHGFKLNSPIVKGDICMLTTHEVMPGPRENGKLVKRHVISMFHNEKLIRGIWYKVSFLQSFDLIPKRQLASSFSKKKEKKEKE